jgi:hypothetical protein
MSDCLELVWWSGGGVVMEYFQVVGFDKDRPVSRPGALPCDQKGHTKRQAPLRIGSIYQLVNL